MVRRRSQLENLSKGGTIEELITVDDISTKISELSNRLDDLLRRFEVLSSDLANRESCPIRKKYTVPLARISGTKPCPSINQ